MVRLKIAFFGALTRGLDAFGGWIGGELSEWVWSFAADDAERLHREKRDR